MPKQLPGTWDLVTDSWRQFQANWNQTTRITVWLIYFGLAEFGIYLLTKFFPAAGLLLIPLAIGVAVVTIWVGIRLMLAHLRLEEGKALGDLSRDESVAWSLFFPLLWIGLLQFLIVMGGFLLFIIPGIYLSVAMTFGQLILIDQGKRGFEALSVSRQLIMGRWWSLFWRLLCGSLVFGLGILVIQGAALAVFSLLVGPTHFLSLMTSENPDPLFSGTLSLLSTVMQAATLPLFFGFQVKLYRALQKTK